MRELYRTIQEESNRKGSSRRKNETGCKIEVRMGGVI
jgi:hypothetical protein